MNTIKIIILFFVAISSMASSGEIKILFSEGNLTTAYGSVLLSAEQFAMLKKLNQDLFLDSEKQEFSANQPHLSIDYKQVKYSGRISFSDDGKNWDIFFNEYGNPIVPPLLKVSNDVNKINQMREILTYIMIKRINAEISEISE